MSELTLEERLTRAEQEMAALRVLVRELVVEYGPMPDREPGEADDETEDES